MELFIIIVFAVIVGLFLYNLLGTAAGVRVLRNERKARIHELIQWARHFINQMEESHLQALNGDVLAMMGLKQYPHFEKKTDDELMDLLRDKMEVIKHTKSVISHVWKTKVPDIYRNNPDHQRAHHFYDPFYNPVFDIFQESGFLNFEQSITDFRQLREFGQKFLSDDTFEP